MMTTSTKSTSPALSPERATYNYVLIAENCENIRFLSTKFRDLTENLSPEKPQGIRDNGFVHPSEGQNWLDEHQRWLESHGLPEDGFLESHQSPSDHQCLPIPQRLCETSQGIRNIVLVESFESLSERQLQLIDHRRLYEVPNVLSEKSQGTHSHASMEDEISVDPSESQQVPESSFRKSLAVIMMTVN